ncbi:MAG: NADH-quinone oxidoreductase subunit NuoK [Planctomycetota bacterium]
MNPVSLMTPEELRTLMVGAGLFVLGAIGFITRRNLILLVLSAELMLHGVSLSLVTFGKMHQTAEGQAFTIFVLTVAACEAGLALSLVLSLYRQVHSLDIRLWTELREPDVPQPPADDSGSDSAEESAYAGIPKLTPAGVAPRSVPAETVSTRI